MELKIIKGEVLVSNPGRNFVTLKLHTDQGIYGLGDATLNGRELAVKSYLEEHLIPCLSGRNPLNTEDIWQFMYRGAYWRGGPVTMASIGAVDMALWDIKGKYLETPVYNLLGGKSRSGVLVYGHANGEDIEETVDQVGEYLDEGYKAVRAQCGVPGLSDTYGVAEEKKFYEPAEKGLPVENVWSTDKYMNHIPVLFDKLRDVYGEEIHLLHDAHHRLRPIEAARLGKELEPYNLFWLEDPISPEMQERYKVLREHTTTPIATGETLFSVYECHSLITNQLIDYLRVSALHGGGISSIMKMAHMAEPFQILSGWHGATDLSPITLAAQLHINLAINNFGIQEYMLHTDQTYEVFDCPYYFDDGYLHLVDRAGLGVEYDEKKAEKYTYERAYLPINRKEDGTMFNW